MTDSVSGYDQGASALADRYESLVSARVHEAILDLLPPGNGRRALDVGAGSGRDAAWLASLSYDVVAAEPSAALRREAKRRHPNAGVKWISDRLPGLPDVYRLGLKFDVILLSAVLMHVRPEQQVAAIANLARLLKSSGFLFLSIRSGPAPPGRPMWDVDVDDLKAVAARLDLNLVRETPGRDQFARPGIGWTSFAFQRDC